ncbi:MAG: 50S ribosomal protein L29 [Chromatiales bacterium]|jgi:large subunit ribosomal protein L29|nr:50S ribosomal protein L29 [Chromatiales bacterium]
MKATELRQKSDSELRDEMTALRKEAFALRMQKGTGQLTRGSQVRAVRRDIARVETILTERTRGGDE